ncbi:hypothetical protein H6P81_008592 [Aristolochia fimbriata]|uniref:Uncharacterized protein n=1 Tax=Aristolochia fimbriata TaxID=158543 RepID=A0AAV7EIH2_ARIFI|nr:hypothetical protein H6P81_008592 [Aristolochia fimbriata]
MLCWRNRNMSAWITLVSLDMAIAGSIRVVMNHKPGLSGEHLLTEEEKSLLLESLVGVLPWLVKEAATQCSSTASFVFAVIKGVLIASL